jgi:hypothetical protein
MAGAESFNPARLLAMGARLGRPSRRTLNMLFGIVVLLALVAPRIGRDSTLRMEAAELGLGRLPASDAWWAVERGVVETPAPLGHLVTRHALRVGLWGPRLLSLLAGAASVVLIGWMAGSFFGPWESTVATALGATLPAVVLVSAAAGVVPLFLLFSAISLLAWHRGLTARSRFAWPAFIVASIGMVYTHHLGMLVVLAQTAAVGVDALIWSLTQHRTRRARSGLPYVQYLFSVGLVALAFLPWILGKDLFPRGYVESSQELVTIAPSTLAGVLVDLTAGLTLAAPLYGIVLVVGVWDALRRRRSSGPRGKLYVDTRHRRPMQLLLSVAVVFFPAAVAASFASRVALHPRSLVPLVVVGAVMLARGVTALAGRRYGDSGWRLSSRGVAIGVMIAGAALNVAGGLAGATDRLGGGREAFVRLREFLRGSVTEADLLAISGRSDITGLAAWAAPAGTAVTAAWGQRPGLLLAKVASRKRTWFLRRDVFERSGRVDEQIVIEGATVEGLVDIGEPDQREALGPTWGRDHAPRDVAPWSRAFLLDRQGVVRVRLGRTLPNAVVLHLFTLKVEQTLSLTVNGVPCGRAHVPRGWNVVLVPVEQSAFRRNSVNEVRLRFSSLNPTPKGRPFSVIADLVVLERRFEPRVLDF